MHDRDLPLRSLRCFLRNARDAQALGTATCLPHLEELIIPSLRAFKEYAVFADLPMHRQLKRLTIEEFDGRDRKPWVALREGSPHLESLLVGFEGGEEEEVVLPR